MYDALVVGAGPGGAATATALAQAGLKPLLIDRAAFPRDKVCGDAVSGKSVDVLRRLGALGAVAPGDRLDSWGVTFGGPHGDAVSIPFTRSPGQGPAPGFLAPRLAFDAALAGHAVAAGATLWEEATVEALVRDGPRASGLRVRRGRALETVRAPLVVGADGAYSAVARSLGFSQLVPRHYCAGLRAYYEGVTGFHTHGFIELHFVEEAIPGYFWIFPLPGGRANVGLGMLSAVVKRRGVQLKPLLERLVAHPRFRDRFAQARRVGPVRGWGLPLGSRTRPLSGDGWMLVGDAASLIDPFTGEGIGNALLSGTLAARWAAEAHAAGRFDAAFLQGYARDVREALGAELRLSHALQRLGAWKWLLNAVIAKASRSPELADTISCMFDDLSQRRRLTSPAFYWRVLTA